MSPSPDRTRRQRSSARWLLLLGLLFLLVGLGLGLLGIVPTVHDALRMRDWQPVPAALLEASLERRQGSKGSVTHIAKARYRYEFGGVLHLGQRVAISDKADNIGNFWPELGHRLEHAHRQRQAVTAWVNPDQPGQAVLDRTLRWPLLALWAVFGLVFGGVGAGLMAGALRAHRRASAPPHPGAATQPWLADAAWATPAIASRARAEGWALLGMGSLLGLVGSAASVVALPQAWNGRPIVGLVLLFPLVGLVLLWQAFRHRGRMRRYGNPSLVLDPHPAPLGGRAGMSMDLPMTLQPGLRFSLSLSALERRSSGSAKNRSTREHLDWETEDQARIEATAEGIRLRWSVEVPAHLGPSAPPDSPGRVWRVSAKGHGPAADFDAHFDIPVFDTGQAQSFADDSFAAADPWGNGSGANEALARTRLQATCDTRMDIEGALLLTQPYRRQWAMKSVWLATGLLFFGTGAFMAHEEGGAVWMGVVFASAGLLTTTFSFWSMATRRSARLGQQAGLGATRHFLGVPIRHRHWPTDAVQHLGRHLSYSMHAAGKRSQQIFQVRAILRDGGYVVLADGIDGEAAALLLMDDIARHTGWPLHA